MHSARAANEYIDIDVSRCHACGRCVTACRNGVLELTSFKRVVYAAIVRPKHCTGCLSCAAACREHAIRPVSADQ